MILLQNPPLPPLPPLPPEVVIQTGGGPPEVVMVMAVSIVAILVGSVVLWPLVRAFARRIEGKAIDPGLAAEVEQLRARVAELESGQHRIAELEERMDFSERLLSQGRQTVTDREER